MLPAISELLFIADSRMEILKELKHVCCKVLDTHSEVINLVEEEEEGEEEDTEDKDWDEEEW
jgi:hypothetical protein